VFNLVFLRICWVVFQIQISGAHGAVKLKSNDAKGG